MVLMLLVEWMEIILFLGVVVFFEQVDVEFIFGDDSFGLDFGVGGGVQFGGGIDGMLLKRDVILDSVVGLFLFECLSFVDEVQCWF